MSDDRSFSRDMDDAPQDAELVLLIPTGDKDYPLSTEIGMWDDNMGQWTGPWRNTDGEGSYAHAEPIAWAYPPEIDQDIADEYGIELVEVDA